MGKTLEKIVPIMVVVILLVTFITVKHSLADEGASSHFVFNNDGTILDTRTNLSWAAKDNGKDIDWADAKVYCQFYNGGDHNDWRMPTKDELKGIFDRLIFGNNGFHFETNDDLTKQLVEFVEKGDLILFKGSRGMALEEVVNVLMN